MPFAQGRGNDRRADALSRRQAGKGRRHRDRGCAPDGGGGAVITTLSEGSARAGEAGTGDLRAGLAVSLQMCQKFVFGDSNVFDDFPK